MNKKLRYFLTAGTVFMLLFAVGCAETQSGDQASVNSNQQEILPVFETRQVTSLDKNVYQVLKFANEDVSYDIEGGNKFYSSKNNNAITVELYEDLELTFNDVISLSMDYIKENITELKVVSEDETKIQYHIEYDIMGECKTKDVVCLKTKTGIILHDLTMFKPVDDVEVEEQETILNEFLAAI